MTATSRSVPACSGPRDIAAGIGDAIAWRFRNAATAAARCAYPKIKDLIQTIAPELMPEQQAVAQVYTPPEGYSVEWLQVK